MLLRNIDDASGKENTFFEIFVAIYHEDVHILRAYSKVFPAKQAIRFKKKSSFLVETY